MTCLSCNLSPANSDEHVFPSALGGKLQFRVLCTNCNSAFGASVDLSLVAAFDALRIALGVEGNRGQTASARVVDDMGRSFILRSGGIPEPAQAPPVVEADDGTTKTMRFPFEKAARQYMEAMKRKGTPIVVKSVEVVSAYPGTVELPQLAVGGDAFFRSALKTALVFAAGRGIPVDRSALANAWTYVLGADATKVGVRAFLSAAKAPWSDPNLGVAAHRVAVDLRDGVFRADVRYFGGVAVFLEISVDSRATWSFAHGVDPLTGATAEGAPSPIDAIAEEPSFEQRAKHMNESMSAVMTMAVETARRASTADIIENTFDEVLGDLTEGAPISKEAHERLAHELAEKMVRQVFRLDSRRAAPEIFERLITPKKNE